MHSTLRHLHTEPPAFDPARTVGRLERSPDVGGGRVAEGGLRLQGRYMLQTTNAYTKGQLQLSLHHGI